MPGVSFLDRQIVRDLIRAWARAELELDELLDLVTGYFRKGVTPTTPPESGT